MKIIEHKRIDYYPLTTIGELIIDGEHLCKTMRGTKKKGKMRSSSLKATLKTDTATRAEFMDWVNVNV